MEWYIDSKGVTMSRYDLWEGGNDQDPREFIREKKVIM